MGCISVRGDTDAPISDTKVWDLGEFRGFSHRLRCETEKFLSLPHGMRCGATYFKFEYLCCGSIRLKLWRGENWLSHFRTFSNLRSQKKREQVTNRFVTDVPTHCRVHTYLSAKRGVCAIRYPQMYYIQDIDVWPRIYSKSRFLPHETAAWFFSFFLFLRSIN
jgi:hypothetical protein